MLTELGWAGSVRLSCKWTSEKVTPGMAFTEYSSARCRSQTQTPTPLAAPIARWGSNVQLIRKSGKAHTKCTPHCMGRVTMGTMNISGFFKVLPPEIHTNLS